MKEELALNGGKPVKTSKNIPMFPGGMEIGEDEKKAVMEVLDRKYLFRYYGPEEYPSKVKEFEEVFIFLCCCLDWRKSPLHFVSLLIFAGKFY